MPSSPVAFPQKIRAIMYPIVYLLDVDAWTLQTHLKNLPSLLGLSNEAE